MSSLHFSSVAKRSYNFCLITWNAQTLHICAHVSLYICTYMLLWALVFSLASSLTFFPLSLVSNLFTGSVSECLSSDWISFFGINMHSWCSVLCKHWKQLVQINNNQSPVLRSMYCVILVKWAERKIECSIEANFVLWKRCHCHWSQWELCMRFQGQSVYSSS